MFNMCMFVSFVYKKSENVQTDYRVNIKRYKQWSAVLQKPYFYLNSNKFILKQNNVMNMG